MANVVYSKRELSCLAACIDWQVCGEYLGIHIWLLACVRPAVEG
jgi:hypothetical protein